MARLLAFFIDRHLLVNMVVVTVLGVGAFVLFNTQREGFPATSLNIAQVTTILPGASSRDIEEKLTIPIEDALHTVDGIDTLSSTSSDGISQVVVEMEPRLNDEETDEVVSDIQKALDRIGTFPPDLETRPSVVVFNPALFPALEIFLHGTESELIPFARTLATQLERIEGVNNISELGFGDPEVHVLINPERLQSLGLTLDEVLAAIHQRNRNDTGGTLISHPVQKQIILLGSYEKAEDVAETVIRFDPFGGLVKVKDVGRIVSTHRDKGLAIHANGKNGVSLVIRKQASADIISLVDNIRAHLDQIQFPQDVSYIVFNDASDWARNRLDIVVTNGLSGICLVLIVLVFFLSRRIAFWVAFGIPFAVLGVLALLPLVGITVNMVSMAAFVLVIGLIVDDAIIVAERIAYYRERGLPPRDAGIKGASDMAMPVLAASLTSIMAFMPMFALGGLPGKFSWAIPTIVILALAVSLCECFFLLPAHVSSDHGKSKKNNETQQAETKAGWILRFEGFYCKALEKALAHKHKLVLIFVAFFFATIAYAKFAMPFTLFPQDDARALYIQMEMPLGTSLEAMSAATAYVEQQLPAIMQDELEGYTARIGHRDMSIGRSLGEANHHAIITAFLHEDHQNSALWWASRLREQLTPLDGLTWSIRHQIIGPPLGRPVELQVSSNDEQIRNLVTLEITDALSKINGLTNIDTNVRAGLTQINLRPDYLQLAQKGVDVETVSRTIKAAFYGIPITETRQADLTTKIRVRLDGSARQSLDALMDLKVRARTGQLYPLRDLVHPEERPSIARIYHQDRVQTVTITASLKEGTNQTSTSIAQLLTSEILPRYKNNPNVLVEIGGEAKSSQKTLGEMPVVALMSLVGMLMIITLLFGSVLQAFFIIIAVPLGYSGVVLTFALHNYQLSFFALLGAVGLSGIVVNDSIVMVNTLATHAHNTVSDVVRAASQRVRPILLTSLTTVVGLIPTAYGLGGRDALLSPMSLALGWGLAFATTITLFLVPALFLVRMDFQNFMSKKFGKG
jgi:multidrug efflux pump subunit AcrB